MNVYESTENQVVALDLPIEYGHVYHADDRSAVDNRGLYFVRQQVLLNLGVADYLSVPLTGYSEQGSDCSTMTAAEPFSRVTQAAVGLRNGQTMLELALDPVDYVCPSQDARWARRPMTESERNALREAGMDQVMEEHFPHAVYSEIAHAVYFDQDGLIRVCSREWSTTSVLPPFRWVTDRHVEVDSLDSEGETVTFV